MFGFSGLVVAMVGDALSAGSGEAVASGGSDGVSLAAVFLVGGDVADAGVQADGVEVFLTLRDRSPVFSSRIGGWAVVVGWSW